MDLENCVAIRLLVGAVIQFAATDNPAPVFVHDADHDAAVHFSTLDAPLQISVDGIGEILRLRRK
jgi:hypothetical protein